MRTNIVLDEALIKEAIRLTQARSRREAVHIALQELVRLRRAQQMPRQVFFNAYLQQPIQLPNFTPMSRDDLYAR